MLHQIRLNLVRKCLHCASIRDYKGGTKDVNKSTFEVHPGPLALSARPLIGPHIETGRGYSPDKQVLVLRISFLFYDWMSFVGAGVFDNHGKKGFVIPTKSFVKMGITKIFCYNNKMFGSPNKTFGCCGIIFGCGNKHFICCPLFCCRNKTIFFRAGPTRSHWFRLMEC